MPMGTLRKEEGVAVVEAAIYLPFVLGFILFMVYIAFFKMEEYAMYYVVDRAATEAAREAAYQGYAVLGMNEGRDIDFSWEGNTPSEEDVTKYFESKHKKGNASSFTALYRSVGKIFSAIGFVKPDTSEMSSKYDKLMKDIALISQGTLTKPKINVKTGLFSSTVTVTISHSVDMPGILRYMGLGDDMVIMGQTTKKVAVNPTDFVRDVELVDDITNALLDKFDTNGNVRGFLDKVKSGIDAIL